VIYIYPIRSRMIEHLKHWGKT